MSEIFGIVVGSVSALLLCAGAIVALSFCVPSLPFVPSGKRRIQGMIALSDVQPGQHVADLGSGDGRLVIAFAKAGAIVHGYEINPLLVWWSRRRIKALHLEDRATIFLMDFFHADLSGYDVLTIYGISTIMKHLEAVVRPQLKTGGRVLVNSVAFPTWQAAFERGGIHVYS